MRRHPARAAAWLTIGALAVLPVAACGSSSGSSASADEISISTGACGGNWHLGTARRAELHRQHGQQDRGVEVLEVHRDRRHLRRLRRSNYVSHNVTDQSSVVSFIENNWLHGQRLGHGSFDVLAGNLAGWDGVLDFHNRPNFKPVILNPTTGAVVKQ
jgi:hypothetical protein